MGGGRGGGWGINSDPLDDYAAGFTDDEVDEMGHHRAGSRYENHARFGSKGTDQEPRSKGGYRQTGGQEAWHGSVHFLVCVADDIIQLDVET